jgi:glycosyltransferase involved in cell wall biosynthesis
VEQKSGMVRIVEFGPVALFVRTHPSVTRWIFAGRSTGHLLGSSPPPFGVRQVFELLRHLRNPDAAFVACHVPPPQQSRSKLIQAGYDLILRQARLPIVGLDFNDEVPISQTGLRVLDRCAVYFKRELPVDRARLLPDAAQAARATLDRNMSKIRSASLGLADWRLADAPAPALEPEMDIFFVGALYSDMRRRGAELLHSLADQHGLKLDFPAERLDRPAYLRRMTQSYLAWSPEGLGWQCFRHFEAAVLGSVPVINRPTIEMPNPLRDGEHCFYYDPDGDDLLRVVRSALRDKHRLRRMGEAAGRHVMQHHTHGAVVLDILDAVGEMSGIDPVRAGLGQGG